MCGRDHESHSGTAYVVCGGVVSSIASIVVRDALRTQRNLMITYNYESMFSLVEVVRSKIQGGELDLALRMIHDVVERIVTEPLCTSKVYGSQGS